VSEETRKEIPVVEAELVDAELVEPPVIADKPTEREVSTTVGTGSYVAVSCTAMALLLTLLILGVLFIFRWLS